MYQIGEVSSFLYVLDVDILLIYNYFVYRKHRQVGLRSGVAIVIKNPVWHDILPDLDTRSIEAIGVEVTLADESKVRTYA